MPGIFSQLGLSEAMGLQRVPEAGGAATPLTMLAEGEGTHAGPQFLPDGRHFLYLRYKPGSDEYRGIYVGSLDAEPSEQSRDRLVETESMCWYAPAA